MNELVGAVMLVAMCLHPCRHKAEVPRNIKQGVPLRKLMSSGTERGEGIIRPTLTAFVLLSISDIQDDLEMTEAQRQGVEDLFDFDMTLISGYAQIRQQMVAELDASSDAREKQKIKETYLRKLSKKQSQFFMDHLNDILSEEQKRRMNGLQLQLHGVTLVFHDECFRTRMKISGEQLDQIFQVIKTYQSRLDSLVHDYLATFIVAPEHRNVSQSSSDTVAKEIWDLWEKREKLLLDLFTEEQKIQLDDIKGPEINLYIAVHMPFYVPFSGELGKVPLVGRRMGE